MFTAKKVDAGFEGRDVVATPALSVLPQPDSTIVLDNWGSACFPRGTVDLHAVYERTLDNLPWLDAAANVVEDFELIGQDDEPRTTSDNGPTVWQVAYFFSFAARGEIAVLFPKPDETGRLHHHTAVFVRGAGEDVLEWIELLVKNFGLAIED